MQKYTAFIFLTILFACSGSESSKIDYVDLEYPETKKDSSIVDNYHGTDVVDEFRWLEVDTAADVKAWVKEQNKVTESFLSQIPYREAIKERYTELFNYEKVSAPYKIGEYYFFSRNDGLQNQAVIYYQKGLDGEAEVFLDPNTMSEEGTAAISLIGFSEDDKYAAYSRQDAGSDWMEIFVMEVATKEQLSDHIKWAKFTGANWFKDGFFYCRYPEPSEGTEYSSANVYHDIYYHKLGDDQSQDKLIYRNTENPGNYHFISITEDRRYLINYSSTGTNGFETMYMDLNAEEPEFKVLFSGYDNKSRVVDNIDDRFLVYTDIDAPKYRLIEVDTKNPSKENWKEIIPEGNHLMQGVSTGGGKLWVSILKDASTRIFRYDYDGTHDKKIKLPGLGTASGFGARKDADHFFYTYTSFTRPPTTYKFDIASSESEEFFRSELKFDSEDYTERQVFYTSKDGTKVPMFIVHKKDLVLSGDNPTYLYAYGGFNVNMTPSFSTSRLLLLENGGVFAMPNLRGGGEYGEDWHKAGMLDKKQNVFDDFIAAAEYLIRMKYTSKEKLAIAGGSNGGLLVGACMTQRPDLFAVAFPAVGVMDMLRYHKFTVGAAWIPEYGSSEDPEQFDNLLSYSPLHKLKEGTNYPATMVTTADHDDRVVPAHSFKFGAKLQDCHSGDEPVILRIETDAGHGAGKPTSKIIEEVTDIWSFFFYNTNSPVGYLQG